MHIILLKNELLSLLCYVQWAEALPGGPWTQLGHLDIAEGLRAGTGPTMAGLGGGFHMFPPNACGSGGVK